MSRTLTSRRHVTLLLLINLVTLLGVSRIVRADDKAGEWEFPKEWFYHDSDEQRAKHTPLLGKPMPRLSLSDWQNGALKPADLKGKIVVLDFWATWCGPCIKSIPHNNEMYAKYKDKGVEIIGICTANGQEKFNQVVKDHKVAYPSARDKSLSAQKAFKVMWYPTYAVVDRDGKVRAIGLTPNHVEDVIDKLLEETPKTASAGDEAPPAEGAQASAAGGEGAKGAGVDPNWLEGTPEQRQALAKIEGKPAPALTVGTWLNSDPMPLDSLKGKVVLIDFWATWCGPCINSIPHTNALMDKYKDQGLVIIGVCHPKGVEKMADTVKQHGLKFPVAADATGKTNKTYMVGGYPDYYLIDRSGKLRIADCKNSTVGEAIKALLAEPGPTASR